MRQATKEQLAQRKPRESALCGRQSYNGILQLVTHNGHETW